MIMIKVLTETVWSVTRTRRRGKPRSPKVHYQWFECWNFFSVLLWGKEAPAIEMNWIPVTPSNLVSRMSQVTDTHIRKSPSIGNISRWVGQRGSHLTPFQLKFARSKKRKKAGEISRMKIPTEIFFNERGKTNTKTKNVWLRWDSPESSFHSFITILS